MGQNSLIFPHILRIAVFIALELPDLDLVKLLGAAVRLNVWELMLER